MPERALILAPHGRDAKLAQTMLAEGNMASEILPSFDSLLASLNGEAGFAVVTEEAVRAVDPAQLLQWREAQPEWSDFPFILLTARGGVERNPAAARYLALFGNVTFVERPFHPTTLVALARSALRGRRKQYEARARLEALHRGEERFRAAIDAVQGVLWTNSPDGRMEGEQPGWGALTGQSFEEYQNFGWSLAVHPDDAQPTIDAWNVALERNSLFAFEHRVRRHDGEWRNFSIRAIPTFTIAGRLREWVGVHTDITDQRQAEASLRHLNATLEERVQATIAERKVFADIFETTDSFVHVLDNDGRWLAFNRAAALEFKKIFGRTPRVGMSLFEMLVEFPEDQAKALRVWGRALNGEQFTQVETFGDKGSARRSYEMKFNVLRDASGTKIGAFQVNTDVTQRIADAQHLAQTQDALRQAQKMEAIGQLTGGVAHDFNNLLTIITSGVSLLKKPGISPENHRLFADAISDAAQRAAKLTQQLLAFSRRQPLRPQVFDVGEQVSATADMLRTIVGGRIVMSVECDRNLKANADIAQFDTALVNLCVNARDAMGGEGRLSIRAFHDANFVCVAINDEGDGIDQDILPRLFEPFFTTKDVGKGTGLGLSQVYGFSRQSGGDVRVTTTKGVGTTFTLCLPQASGPIATEPSLEEAAASGNSHCILVVEDNDDLRVFACTLLSELGHETEAVASGVEAIARLTAEPHRFEIVFTDVIMAGMSGLDLARQIKATWPEIKIVLTSGYSDALANAEGLEFPLVSKPYSGEQLAAVF